MFTDWSAQTAGTWQI